tara:strand:- start:1767 stop:2540 length:774 start_codon:yes stop_codon:yes gene_type:complete
MAKDGLMHIFQEELKRLTADLELQFRGMKVSPIVTKSNEIDLIFLEDFIFITKWLQEHSEVKYVHFELDVQTLVNPIFKSLEELQIFRIKFLELQKEIHKCASTFFLSGSGNFNLFWSEFLSLFEDVTLIENSQVVFDHTKKGLITIFDPVYIQNKLGVSRTFLTIPRNVELSTTSIEALSSNELKNKIKTLKEVIYSQSELAKIQMRASVDGLSNHHSLFNGNLKSEDWSKSENEFTKLRDLKPVVTDRTDHEYLN